MRLRLKLVLILLFCGLAPLMAASLLSYAIARDTLNVFAATARAALLQDARDTGLVQIAATRRYVENFINTIHRETLVLTGSGLPLRAISGLGPAAQAFLEEIPLEPDARDEQRAALDAHYAKAFADAPQSQAAGALDDMAAALQYAYLLMDPALRQEALAGAAYEILHAEFDAFFQHALRHMPYRNIVLVDAEDARVLYSARPQALLATSLRTGPWRETGLAQAVLEALESSGPDSIAFADFAPFLPGGGQPACFFACPILDARGNVAGAVAVQLDDAWLEGVSETPEPGASTAENILVGPDFLPRTTARLDGSGRFNLRAALEAPDPPRIDPPVVRRAIEEGAASQEIGTDYRGEEALMACAPIDLPGTRWALLSKIDANEAFATLRYLEAAANDLGGRLLFWRYAIAGASVAALVALGLFFSRPIVIPLQNTVAMLRRLAEGKGDLGGRLSATTRDEVGELAHWFNAFMRKVQLVHEELAAKTAALERYQQDLESHSKSLEQEIAERKRAEALLAKSERYYRRLIENAPDIIVVLDEDRAPKYVSPAFARIFGYAPDEIDGRPLSDFVHPDDLEAMMRAGATVEARPGAPLRTECRIRRKDGVWRHVSVVGANHLDDPNVRGIVLNMRDVTRRKEAERILRDYSTHLETEVTQRTIDLQRKSDDLAAALERLKETQQQLIIKEKLASLGALTAGIAHEIKNPLNFVNNFAELNPELAGELREEIAPLLEHAPDASRDRISELLDDLAGNARRILDHGRRADTIVRNMLQHSRAKPGAFETADINAIVEEYAHLAYHGLRAQDSAFNVRLETDLAPDLPRIQAVPQDIARVVLNLVNNACQAARERKQAEGREFTPRVWVRTSRPDPGHLEIRVGDNGGGIPDDVRPRLFTPFFTTKPAGQGTGLGLSISHEIVVREHGGAITVESEPGRGAEFVVRLPVRQAAPPPGDA